MGLLDAYADSTENVLNVMAARPVDPEPAKPKHSAWSAIPRAVASAATEIGGNIIDTAAAYGQVAAASGGLTPGFDPDQTKNRAASVEAMDKLKTEGIDWRTEESQTQYACARGLRPDPVTAGHAENLVFGLTRGLTKAIGAATTLGPVAGALAFGGSEGMTDADALAAQGVDLATRTKVGAVSASVNAAGVALPVAGNTLAKTVGLVAVGGPLSFITQQQATRSILEAADYHDIAKQYDPLDPVGLTVATLVPAGFAVAARAGARGSAKAPDIVPTRDDIDAAMVHNLTTIRDVHEAVSADIAAAEPVKTETMLHGSDAVFDQFAIQDGRNPALFFSKPEGRKTQAEHIAEGPFGGNLYQVEVGKGKKFDPLNDPVAMDIYRQLFPERADKPGKFIEYSDIYIGSPLISAMKENGYNRVKVYEPSVQAFSEAVTDPSLINITSRNGTPVKQKPEIYQPAADQAAKPAEDVTPDAYRARVEQLATEQPDLVARLDDAGQPVRLADELEAVRKSAQEGTDTEFGALDAPLLKVAAECALATGTAAL